MFESGHENWSLFQKDELSPGKENKLNEEKEEAESTSESQAGSKRKGAELKLQPKRKRIQVGKVYSEIRLKGIGCLSRFHCNWFSDFQMMADSDSSEDEEEKEDEDGQNDEEEEKPKVNL